jgi:replicative DNA helicase
MSVGFGLLYHILNKKPSLLELSRVGVDEKFFVDEEKEVFQVINNHFTRYGLIPSKVTVEAELPHVTIQKFPIETLDYWLDSIIARHKENHLRDSVQAIAGHLRDGDLDKADEVVSGMLQFRQTQGIEDFCSLEDMKDVVIDAHDARQLAYKIGGIPFGFASLDKQSDGSHPGDLNVIVGRPGTGKTYLMCRMALAAHWAGYSVLFVSFEMSLLRISQRFFSLMSGVPVKRLQHGRLSYFGRELLLNVLNGEVTGPRRRGMDPATPFHLVKGSFVSTVGDLQTLILHTNPDIVFVDGAYLLQTPDARQSRSDRVTTTVEQLKALSQMRDLPVIASYQFNREATKKTKAGIEHIYMSDAIGQLSSVVLGIGVDEEDGENEGVDRIRSRTRKIAVLKGREGESSEFEVMFDLVGMQIEEILTDSPYAMYDEPDPQPSDRREDA